MRKCVFLIFAIVTSIDATAKNHLVLDLTRTLISGKVPYWSEDEKFQLKTLFNGTEEYGGYSYWFKRDSIASGTHMGTHLDAPCHFKQNGWCVSDIPIERLVAPAVVVDIRNRVADDGDTFLTPDDLINWENRHGPIPKGSILLVLTGWGRFWNDTAKYWGTEYWNTSNLHFPGVGVDAATWLILNRDIYGLGVDTLSVDYGQMQPPRVHILMAAQNIFNLENVANLEKMPATGATVLALPIKIEGASGAPTRLIAVFNPEVPSRNCLKPDEL